MVGSRPSFRERENMKTEAEIRERLRGIAEEGWRDSYTDAVEETLRWVLE